MTHIYGMEISFCDKRKDLKIGAAFAENQNAETGNARVQICERAERGKNRFHDATLIPDTGSVLFP